MPANYDTIAHIYDPLSRIVFGKHIMEAQVCLLKYIPPQSRILIIGGGSGLLLEKIAEQFPQGLVIDYVEASAEMIAISKKRKYGLNAVNFIHEPIEDHVTDSQYDVIITPFIFDNFTTEIADKVFAKSNALLRSNGLWLYVDFVYDKAINRFWQKALLKVMYLFFRIMTGMEAQRLVNMNPYFVPAYQIEFETYHYFKFIRSAVYRKIN